MKIPIVGPTYNLDAVSFDLQRSINLYPIFSESGTSKEVSALKGTPGYDLFATAGTGPIRNCISSTSGRAFVVSGDTFYEIDALGVATNRGTLNSSVGRVNFAESGTQIMLVDGTNGYIFTLATNVLSVISDVDYPDRATQVTFQDGYFIVPEPDTQKLYISAINDGTSWDALDFTLVQSSSDNLTALLSDHGVVWCFGNRSGEVYENTGNAAFPFERIEQAIIPTGCAAPDTLLPFDNGIIWLGVDENGRGIVWRNQGFNAARVSTQAIEDRIASVNDFTESYAWIYHQNGHLFYCLQVKGLDATLVLDAVTGMWHERTYFNQTLSRNEPHKGSCHMFFNQRNLIGDRSNGNIYQLKTTVYSDNGDEIHRERITPHLHDEMRLIKHSSLHIDMETGVGLTTGQGSDPQLMMRYSDDGGNTWSNERWVSIGKKGKYKNRARFTRLGQARDRVYKIKITDPVFVQINGAYLNA